MGLVLGITLDRWVEVVTSWLLLPAASCASGCVRFITRSRSETHTLYAPITHRRNRVAVQFRALAHDTHLQAEPGAMSGSRNVRT